MVHLDSGAIRLRNAAHIDHMYMPSLIRLLVCLQRSKNCGVSGAAGFFATGWSRLSDQPVSNWRHPWMCA